MRKFAVAAMLFVASVTSGYAGDFYRGKTITYIVATGPGGNYDAYARLVARHLAPRLEVEKIFIKNIPGAGHIIGTNVLYAAEPDGLTFGTFNTGLIYAQILRRDGIEFDLSRLDYVGKASAEPRAVVLAKTSGLPDFKALIESGTEVVFGTPGVGTASYSETQLLSSGLNLPIKLVPGYRGNEGEMAMLRGELVGQIGSVSSFQPFIDAGHGQFALFIGGDAQPQARDFATTQKGQAIVELITAMSSLGRISAMPPGVPAHALAEMRDAYMAVMQDPDFLAEAAKIGLPIDPARGDAVGDMVRSALQQTPETIEIISEALNVEIETVTAKGPLLSLEDSNRVITFTLDAEVITAQVSGSRTAITIDAESAERSALTVGMVCEIEFDPNHDQNEPKTMDCVSG